VVTTSLTRRLDSLEEASMRRTCRRLARETGENADELLAAYRRFAAEYRRLQMQGLPPQELNRRLMEWTAADLGVDADELEVEWERCLKERA
jgi:hypothetical protein